MRTGILKVNLRNSKYHDPWSHGYYLDLRKALMLNQKANVTSKFGTHFSQLVMDLTKTKRQAGFKTCNSDNEWGFCSYKEIPLIVRLAIKIHKETRNKKTNWQPVSFTTVYTYIV